MFEFKGFLLGLLIGGVTAVVSMQYHFVQTHQGLVVIPRTHQAPLRSAYADVRQWGPSTWQLYPELAEAMIQSGRADLMVSGAINNIVSPEREHVAAKPSSAPVQSAPRANVESLVPIRFSHPSGIVPIPEEMIYESVEEDSPRASRPIKGGALKPNSSAGYSRDVMPAGLPKIKSPAAVQTPSPSFSSQPIAQADIDESSHTDKKGWVTNLLQSLIPNPNEGSTAQHDSAHLPNRSSIAVQEVLPSDDVWLLKPTAK